MAETLPAEAPYTLRDISELLDYRVRLSNFELRRRTMDKMSYSSSEYYNYVSWVCLNTPQSKRLTEEVTPTLSVYRRLVKEARGFALTVEVLPVLVGDILEGSPTKLSDALDMPLCEFESIWNAKLQQDETPHQRREREYIEARNMHIGRVHRQIQARLCAPPGEMTPDEESNYGWDYIHAWFASDALKVSGEMQANEALYDLGFDPPGWNEHEWAALSAALGIPGETGVISPLRNLRGDSHQFSAGRVGSLV